MNICFGIWLIKKKDGQSNRNEKTPILNGRRRFFEVEMLVF